jgi:hypothetical protein
MAVGRQTVETSNVLTPFNQNQQVRISGSGIQEVEFTDGFRMSIRASQPMVLKTDVVNGVSSSMTTGGIMSVSKYMRFHSLLHMAIRWLTRFPPRQLQIQGHLQSRWRCHGPQLHGRSGSATA